MQQIFVLVFFVSLPRLFDFNNANETRGLMQRIPPPKNCYFCNIYLPPPGKQPWRPEGDTEGKENFTEIYNGTPATNGQFPYAVELATGCSGSLIQPDLVVTAAHCFFDHNGKWLPKETYTIRAGNVRQGQGLGRSINNMCRHPNYVPGSNRPAYDIGLARLQNPYTNVNNVNTIPVYERPLQVGWTCWILGFGRWQGWDGESQHDLTYAQVQIRSHQDCINVYGNLYNSNIHICAGGTGTNQCNGDSGGPLVCHIDNIWYQVGVIDFTYKNSDGSPPCSRGVPGIFTNVIATVNQINCPKS